MPNLKNAQFWTYAQRLLEEKRTLVIAGVFGVISAAGVTVGLVGIAAILERILPSADGEAAQSIRALAQSEDMPITVPDDVLNTLPDTPFASIIFIMIALGLFTVIGATANFLHQYLAFTVCTRTIAKIRKDAFHHTLSLPLSSIIQGSVADTNSRIINDTNVLARGFTALTGKAFAQITKGLAALIGAFAISWSISLIVLVVGPIIGVIIRKLGKRIRRASRGAMKGRAALLDSATESLQGFRVVKSAGAEQRELERFDTQNQRVVQEELRARAARALTSPLTELVALFLIGIMVIVASKAILDGHLDPSTFLSTLVALGVALSSLKPLSNFIQDIQTAEPAAVRIHEILTTPTERAPSIGSPLPRHTQSISFRNVHLTYSGAEQPALAGITLDIPYGARVAFVGPNGSGKTTLLSLVPSLYEPSQGEVLIDSTNIASCKLVDLRAQIGVVSQEVVLFKGTIEENIRYACPDASRQAVINAISIARADAFIEQLGDGLLEAGLTSQVGDQGLTLSGGQRQRIAIARAVLRDPAILIMDEATSMIDAESEQAIAEAIREASADRTTLIVAHRLSTVRDADMIIVLNHGQIEAQGTHDELIESSELYRQLAQHQLTNAGSAQS